MTSILPDIPDAGRYSVKEAADLLGIHQDTLYTYCNSGVVKFGIRKANNRRFITGAEIKRVWKDKY